MPPLLSRTENPIGRKCTALINVVLFYEGLIITKEETMSRIFVTIFLGSFLVIFLNGCSSLAVKNEIEVTVNPSKSHEECMEMMPGDVLSYSFNASEPVDFNIHCHEEGNVVCPVSKKSSKGGEGKFYAEKEQTYCLMWTNIQTKPVRLTYTFDLGKKIKPLDY